jgi:hypothetical protein
VAGVGRGYADDILHRAKLSPYASLKSLKPDERERMLTALQDVLTEGLERERRRDGGLSANKLGLKLEVLEKELAAIQPQLPGLRFQRVSVPNAKGQPATGLYIQIIDYDDWRPCDLNFWMMKLACKYSRQNPFAPMRGREFSGFLRHLGSQAFLNDIAAKGAAVDVAAWLRLWREQAKVYQEQSRKYWLYR